MDEHLHETMTRWLAAVEGHGDAGLTDAAVAPDVEVARYGFGPSRGTIVETLCGTEAVRAWLARTNPVCVFTLEASGSPAAGLVVARYRIDAPDFLGGGEWRARLAPDGRIAHLEHRPDDLRAEYAPELPAGAGVVFGTGEHGHGGH